MPELDRHVADRAPVSITPSAKFFTLFTENAIAERASEFHQRRSPLPRRVSADLNAFVVVPAAPSIVRSLPIA